MARKSKTNKNSNAKNANTSSADTAGPSSGATNLASHPKTQNPAEPLPESNKPGSSGMEEGKNLTSDAQQLEVLKDSIGTTGDGLRILVNRFEIDRKKLPKKFYVYTVQLPQLNNRDVLRRDLKKRMFDAMLSQQGPLSGGFARNEILTDRETKVVTKMPLGDIEPDLGEEDGVFLAKFEFGNDVEYTALLRLDNASPFDFSELETYLAGDAEACFPFEKYMTILNIFARHFAHQNAIRVGRNRIFQAQNTVKQMDSGLERRYGFYNSVRPGLGHLQLQLQSSATAFYPSIRLLDFLGKYLDMNFARTTNFSAAQVTNMKAITRQLSVRYLYTPPNPRDTDAKKKSNKSPIHNDPVPTGQPKRITGIGNPADKEFFTHGQHGHISVAAYFNQHILATPLKFPTLPAVNTGAQPGARQGHPVWVPMELIWIEPNQALRGILLGDKDMTSMAEIARKTPASNVIHIEGSGVSLINPAALRSHDVLHVHDQMAMVNARKLPAPRVGCKQDFSQIDTGKWNMKGSKNLLEGTSHAKLLVIRIRPNPHSDGSNIAFQTQQMGEFLKGLGRYGVNFGKSEVQDSRDSSMDSLDQAWSAQSQPQTNTILVIMDMGSDIYSDVKRWADLQWGLNVVCMTRKNVKKSFHDPGFQANIALKFNLKLGGRNWELRDDTGSARCLLKDMKTMIVGADVTHPGPTSVEHCPSIAAVVASTSDDCAAFPGSMRLQRSKTEEILDLRMMMMERLRLYHEKQKHLPESILFYRDGVSESQYAMVKRMELSRIVKACTAVGGKGYQPKITFVVCTKRHETRFYPHRDVKFQNAMHGSAAKFYMTKRQTQGVNKEQIGAVHFKPGLVVDDPSIRLPNYFDFYLQGHAPLDGTARPCHYFVIANGMGLTPDQLQKVTFDLSFMHTGSFTPVSAVTPAYYADRLCDRGRVWLRPLLVANHPERSKATHAISGIVNEKAKLAAKHSKNSLDSPPAPETDDIQQAVVDHFENDEKIWPRRSKDRLNHAANPCHANVRDGMFYI